MFACSKPKPGWFQRFAPPEQSFQIDPRQETTVTGTRGTRLHIPRNAFDIDDDVTNIELRLTEAIDGFDMAATNLPMHFEDELGQERTFESAGMFRVQAFEDGDSVSLAKGQSINVEFPNLTPGDKFRVYKYDGKKWEHDGHNQEVPRVRREGQGMLPTTRPAGPMVVGIRQYAIQELTWWNFDYPRVDSVCIKGSVENMDGDFEVITIGHRPKGTHSVFSEAKFRTGALQRGDVSIVVISLTKQSYGVVRRKTGEVWGTYKSPESPHNYCEDFGDFEMKEVPVWALNDRQQFRKLLNLPEEKYAVAYAQ